MKSHTAAPEVEGRSDELERRVLELTEELVRAKEALRKELPHRQGVEEHFRLALEVAPNGVFIIDRDGLIVLVNEQVERLFGYRREEMVGQPVEMLVPARHRDRHAADRARFFDETAARLMGADRAVTGLRKDGTEVPLSILLQPLRTETGAFVLATLTDVTERKRLEEGRKELLKEYRMMFDSVPALIWYKDRDNRILRVNRPAAESMGKSVADLEGHSTYDLYPDEAARYHRDDLEVINSGRPKLGIVEQVVTSSGDKLWVQTDKVPYRNDRGEIVGVIVFAMDVTERQRAQEEVRKLNAELEQRVRERTAQLEAANTRLQSEIAERGRAEAELADRARQLDKSNKRLVEAEQVKSAFFANVSHELRTPLTLILAPLESLLAEECGVVTEEQKSILVILHNNAVRLLQMVTGLLDFSKADAGRIEVKYEPTEVVALTRTILTDFAPLMQQKELKSNLTTDLAEFVVQLDRYLYERILFNLLSNAVKFTPAGGKITVALHLEGDRLRLAVTDTGMGIAASEIHNLFQKFRQLEGTPTRRFEGTGLGLALVKELSVLLGGNTSVDSKVGVGSTFTVECLAPRAELLPEETTLRRPRRPLALPFLPAVLAAEPAPTEAQQDQATIVVAEDNPELASYIATLLRNLASVHIVQDGEEALTLVRRRSPDLVISDVMMPRRDGLSLCKELKENPETAAIPVVLLTALTHREALLKGWEAGADEYLFKPFHPQELVTRIKFMLSAVKDRSRAKKMLAQQAAELARSNAELEQFAYVASHDLQEPLRKVQSFGDMLATACDKALGEEGRDYLQRMQMAAQRMQLLINDLLTFARVTMRANPFVAVDLAQVAREVVLDLETRIRDTKGGVDIGDLPLLDADPMQMRQLLQNLIGNALKYHRPNDPPLVQVRSRVLKDGTGTPGKEALLGPLCELTVQDNGIGFEEKYLDRIFAPFQRLHGRSEYEGTGMGLAICRKIVERHGGTITARSAPGQGATFIVLLLIRQRKGE